MKHNNNRVIYLKIMGACGNQFFQYAFARSVQEQLGGQLVIDYSYVRNDDTLWPGSDNLLKDFNTVSYHYLKENNCYKNIFLRAMNLLRRIFHFGYFEPKTYRLHLWCAKHLTRIGIYYWDAAYYPFRIYPNKNILINGYFESPKYFAEIDDKICRELTSKHPLMQHNEELYRIITEKSSVCISIKRQDIENPDIADVYDYNIDYFYHATDYIKQKEKNPVFIIFSDNIEWCQENFHLDGEVYYETPGNPIWEKVRLMSACKHFIIHNSTFSWWIQHLSVREGKIVIAPVKWMLRDDQPIDIYEEHWIYMRNDGTIQETHD